MLVVFTSFKESPLSPQICLAHSRIPGAKQDSHIGSTLTTLPLPKLARFQKPISYSVEPIGAHALMSVTWLQWREPSHDLRILVGVIESVVDTNVKGGDVTQDRDVSHHFRVI